MRRLGIIILTLCFWLLPLAGRSLGSDTAALSVSATIPSWGYCWFQSNSATLDFGNLAPTDPSDATADTTLSFQCLGWPSVTFHIGHNDGLHGTGSNSLRMVNSAQSGTFLPYQIALDPVSGTIPTPGLVSGWQTLTVTGTIRGSDYKNASPGSYADTVVLSIDP